MSELSPEEVAQFRELLDKQKITQAIYRYARATDRTDVELFRSTFWEEGEFDGGPAPGLVHESASEMLEVDVPKRFTQSHHLFGNITISIEGMRAQVESYAIAYHRTPPTPEGIEGLIGKTRFAAGGGGSDEPHDMVMGLRYVDLWEKRGDEWRILKRRLVPDWTMSGPSTTIVDEGIMQHLRWRGTRGAADPSNTPFD